MGKLVKAQEDPPTVSRGDAGQCSAPDRPVAFQRQSLPGSALKMLSTPLAPPAQGAVRFQPSCPRPAEERGGFRVKKLAQRTRDDSRWKPASMQAIGPEQEPGPASQS